MMPASRTVETWPLDQLFSGLPGTKERPEVDIAQLHLDSREVRPGGLFLACSGTRVHGMDHVVQAVARGAVCVAAEPDDDWPEQRIVAVMARLKTPLIIVPRLGSLLSQIAGRFYGEPGTELRIIGVTGTNGKTSVSHYLAQALQPDWPCGVIGTLGHGLLGNLSIGAHTTPDPLGAQAALRELADAGAAAAAMEVSSHALVQHRVAAIPFDTAVFTNLSHDHLDYHGDMQAYGEAKSKLFTTAGLRLMVVNADDDYGRLLLQQVDTTVKTVAIGTASDLNSLADCYVQVNQTELNDDGLVFAFSSNWGTGRVTAPLLGRFNVENLALVLGVLLAWQVPLAVTVERLANLSPIAGRMECFRGKNRPLVVVDYAHTPDALGKVLAALREHAVGNLFCVFGCGGDRDRAKRPAMGAVAARLADRVILTDDNPRGEDGARIVTEIRAGMAAMRDCRIERDRAKAIRMAIAAALPGDVVLIAGKGHEDYQLVGDLRLSFSDRNQVAAVLAGESE